MLSEVVDAAFEDVNGVFRTIPEEIKRSLKHVTTAEQAPTNSEK